MIREILKFYGSNRHVLRGETPLLCLLVALMVSFALTEALGIGLIAPLLESGNSRSALAEVPLLGQLQSWFPTGDPSRRAMWVGVAMLVVLLVRGALQFGVTALTLLIPVRIGRKLMADTYNLFLQASIAFVYGRKYGDHAVPMQGFADATARTVEQLARIAAGIVVMCAYGLMLLLISWQMTVAAVICLGALFMGIRVIMARPTRRAAEGYNAAMTRQTTHMMESHGGSLLIRSRTAEAPMLRKMVEILRQLALRRFARDIWAQTPRLLLPTGAGAFISLLIIATAYFYRDNPTDWLPVVIMFIVVLFRLLSPISEVAAGYAQITALTPAVVRLAAYRTEASAAAQSSGKRELHDRVRTIAFEQVAFSYAGQDTPAVTDISLSTTSGQRIALVGPSGGGKSTFVALLARLYEPTSGRILVNGEDLQDLDVRSWRRHIGFVGQEPFFFNDSVRENLIFGLDNVTELELVQALRTAEALDFVQKLPDGLDTMLGDRGAGLSGGQRQRLAIARELLANPHILILDEATSQLDTINQQAIQRAIAKLPKEMTVFIIAHRLAMVLDVDEILVLEHGRIVQRGTHTELCAVEGLYDRMFNLESDAAVGGP